MTVFAAEPRIGRRKNVAHDMLSRRIIIQPFARNVSIFSFAVHYLPSPFFAHRVHSETRNCSIHEYKTVWWKNIFHNTTGETPHKTITIYCFTFFIFYMFHNFVKLVIEAAEISNFPEVYVTYIVMLTDTFHPVHSCFFFFLNSILYACIRCKKLIFFKKPHVRK